MVEQIGRLADASGLILHCAGESEFDAFLAHFLGNLERPLLQQTRRIALTGVCVAAIADDPSEQAEPPDAGSRILAEATRRPEMAGRPGGLGKDEEGVTVAVGVDGSYRQVVS